MVSQQRLSFSFLGLAVVAALSVFRPAGIAQTKLKWPQPVPFPKSNPTTPAKVRLGKQLFFDPRLSGDNKMSCATCHLPDKAFGDGLKRGKGHNGKALPRNTQSLWNVGYYSKLFWDGRAATLEEQALIPIQSPLEMNQNLNELEKELGAIGGYVRQFQAAFGTGADRNGIAKALAAFQRGLVTGPSRYDRYRAGDAKALSEAEQRGMELFFGDAACSECHPAPLFTDGKFYRIGVAFEDKGLEAITGKKEDRYRFRAPSLRNVAETGPYMHNGTLKSLSDVVTFYYRQVPRRSPDGLDIDVTSLAGNSFSEIPDVVAFLKALSGETPKIAPPKLP